jgi:hypothetical protein
VLVGTPPAVWMAQERGLAVRALRHAADGGDRDKDKDRDKDRDRDRDRDRDLAVVQHYDTDSPITALAVTVASAGCSVWVGMESGCVEVRPDSNPSVAIRRFRGHTTAVVLLTRFGAGVASAGAAGDVAVWGEDGAPLFVLPRGGGVAAGRPTALLAVGSLALMVADETGAVRMWRKATGAMETRALRCWGEGGGCQVEAPFFLYPFFDIV